MKKYILLLVTLSLISPSVVAASENEEQIANIESQIEQKQAEIEALERELKRLQSGSEEELLEVGDSYTINQITITINNVQFTPTRNDFVLQMPANVLQVNYTVLNESEGDYPLTAPFSVMAEGEELETYPNENTLGMVEAGESIDGIAHYAIPTADIETVHLTWSPIFHFGDQEGTWEIDLTILDQESTNNEEQG